MKQIIKTIFIFALIANLFGYVHNTYAFTINASFCDITPTGVASAPDLVQIVCPILRVYNFLILASGVVLIGMIAIGGIRLSMSLGDPKGFQSASRTWTFTLWGVGLVLGSFLILRILNATLGLGLNFASPIQVFNAFTCKLWRFLDAMLIEQDAIGC